jgi:Chaperone of endosialidase
MVPVTRRSLLVRGIRFSVAVMAAALIGAVFATPAAAQSECIDSSAGGNTFCGTDAGAGATATGDSALGDDALSSGDSGGGNTAIGIDALQVNTTGFSNTATGWYALSSNTGGTGNTATGTGALFSSTTGKSNAATGTAALGSNITGNRNTAMGTLALMDSTTASDNTATGLDALTFDVTGGENTATGSSALKNSTGSNNIAIGYEGGFNLTTGDKNIDIGNEGVAAEANTIRIGTQGTQTDTYIAGIFGTPKIKKACEVVVESTGLLGCVKSSARYKRDIHDIGDASDKLMKLRPVRFTYKGDSTGIQQYGLIAEEVEKVYPELVIDDASGKPETVEYQVLPAMLLNEVQKLAKENRRLAEQVAALKKKDARIDAVVERMNALERQVRNAHPEHLASATR